MSDHNCLRTENREVGRAGATRVQWRCRVCKAPLGSSEPVCDELVALADEWRAAHRAGE